MCVFMPFITLELVSLVAVTDFHANLSVSFMFVFEFLFLIMCENVFDV
jgi:glycopeptide antibiotics resistance protein